MPDRQLCSVSCFVFLFVVVVVIVVVLCFVYYGFCFVVLSLFLDRWVASVK